jgi:hypothetical protein
VPQGDDALGDLPASTGEILQLDLRDEARTFARSRWSVVATGIALGGAFLILGSYFVIRLGSSGFTPELLAGGLLGLLGLGLIILSLARGLVNPVRAIRADPGGLVVQRQWGSAVSVEWSRDGLVLTVDDRTPDPASTPEEKRVLFFSGPGPFYGLLPRTSLDPLTRVARSYGASIRSAVVDERTGRTVHRIRRTQIVGSRRSAVP